MALKSATPKIVAKPAVSAPKAVAVAKLPATAAPKAKAAVAKPAPVKAVLPSAKMTAPNPMKKILPAAAKAPAKALKVESRVILPEGRVRAQSMAKKVNAKVKGKSAFAPGQRKKALGLQSAKTLTKGYDTRSEAAGTRGSAKTAPGARANQGAGSSPGRLADAGRSYAARTTIKPAGKTIFDDIGNFVKSRADEATGRTPSTISRAMDGAAKARELLNKAKGK